MSKLELWYPVKPLHINQAFGSNPDYYSKFKDTFGNPYKGHNGVDFMAIHGQPVFAPIDGLASYVTDEHGGEGVVITTTEALDYAGGTSWFNILCWHLVGDTDPKFPKPFDQLRPVKAGDLIGYANNTGAPFESSGDHLHMGLVPIAQNQTPVAPANGYKGCIDPTPYFNKYFAVDAQKVLTILQKELSLLKSFVLGPKVS